jgi:monoamine oxidase
MAQLLRLLRLGRQCARTGESADEAIGIALEKQALEGHAFEEHAFEAHALEKHAFENQERLRDEGRRRFAQGAVAGVAVAAAGAMTPYAWAASAKLRRTVKAKLLQRGNVAVIGAGLAGLACASELTRLGVNAQVFEAGARVGGRVRSLRGYFPGQTVELGGEFIGRSHHAMQGYARAFGLTLEDASSFAGERYYDFGGRRYTEAQAVDEFRGFSQSIREDLNALSFPTADRHTEADAVFDFMTLDEYLQLHGGSELLRGLIGAAYAAEYGASIDEQSAYSFLRFAHADARTKYSPFGGAGDGRLHVVEGNDRIVDGLARTLPAPVALGYRLVAMRKLASGRVRLTFDLGGRSVQSDYDAVVLALPFSVLRDVQMHASLQLPDWKRFAIDNAAMSDNAKLMVGFDRAYWRSLHDSNGELSSDRAELQQTWESNPSNGGSTGGVLTQLIGGAQARAMDPANVARYANQFVGEVERVLPGAVEAAQYKANGDFVSHLENWSLNPLSKGAYSCHRPGYFTTIAHREAKPVGNLLFAGEHTSSFYEWQGTMEGAVLSGFRAAFEANGILGGR